MAQPYIRIQVSLHYADRDIGPPRLTTCMSVLLEDYSYMDVVQKIYQTFDHPLPVTLQEVLEDKLARIMPVIRKEQLQRPVGFSKVKQKLEEMKRIHMDVDRRISLGELGKVCKHILYADFLQYTTAIQEQIILKYEVPTREHPHRWRNAHDWLYKRGFSLRAYTPGDPGTLFPRRPPSFWRRRNPYEDALGRRGRKVTPR
jgi:hypothetical protein